MGKVVFCIIAVFVLDLAFILFIQSGGDLVEVSRAIRLAEIDPGFTKEVESPELAGLYERTSEDIYSAPEPDPGSISPAKEPTRRAAIRIRPAKNDITWTVSRSRHHAPPQPAEPFTDTVILIERASFVPPIQTDQVENQPIKTRNTSVPNFAPIKRSFFSRAGLVIRKPYDWSKAFASKLF